MISAFKKDTLPDETSLKAVNHKGEEEEADDSGGVFRDLISAFWIEFFMGHAIGENSVIPCIRHDFVYDDWKSVTNILVKGYDEVRYFPIKIAKAFMVSCFFGEGALNDDVPLDSFFNFLPTDDTKVLKEAVDKESLDLSDEDSEVMEIISSLSSKRLAKTGEELKLLLVELAHKEIIQASAYIRDAWADVFSAKELLLDVKELYDIYEHGRPSNKKVMKLLHAEPKNECQRESFQFLNKFVRNLSPEDLSKFLRYTTGADMICTDKLEIMFVEMPEGVSRRIIAHTCGPVMELPTSYTSYVEFKEEFLNLLHSGYWSMDLA